MTDNPKQLPLPLIPELIDKLKGGQDLYEARSTMGLQQRSNQGGGSIQSSVRCRWEIMGTNCYVLLDFQNSPATFQSMMNALFDDLYQRRMGYHLTWTISSSFPRI